MSVDFERELGKFKGDSNEAKAALAELLAGGLRRWRGLYGSLPASAETLPGLDLDAEWKIQTDGFIDHKFWEALGYSDPEEYRLTIPKFSPQLSKEYRGRFDDPIAVEPRIPLPRLHELMDIKDYIDSSQITNDIDIPKMPYTVYIQRDVELVVGTFASAISAITADEVACSMVEVDMYYLRYSELFQNSWRDAGSSRSGAGRVPYLNVFNSEPKVNANWTLNPNRGWRVLSRGKKIGT